MPEDREPDELPIGAGASDDAAAAADASPTDATHRRDFLKQTVRRAAYVAPVVLLFKPREAVAGSGGSAITPGP